MSVLRYKIWYDLWHMRGRTALAIASIAAGVFAIGAIFGLVDQLLSGMDAAHREVHPSHINVILRAYVDDAIVEDLRELDGVLDVDPVNQITVRYKTASDDDWQIGALVMRPDYEAQTYDSIALTDGVWPVFDDEDEAAQNIGVERLSSQYYDIALGDAVTFDVRGESRDFEVSGMMRHPFVEPPLFGGQAHFFADAAGLAVFGIPEGYYGQLLLQIEPDAEGNPYSYERAQEVAGDVRAWLGDRGIETAVTLYQDPDAHWGRMFVEGITLVLQIMAVVSLVLSVVLILNTMTALITQQTDQIGVIKALGGRSRAVLGVYLSEVTVYGAAALIISLPLAAATAFWATRWFLNLFNIEYQVFQFSTRAVVLQIIAALAAPPLAALAPIRKGATITVREAIATYGLGGDFGDNALDRAVERVGTRLLPSPYGVALGNMFRRKGRLAMTMVVLVTAGVMTLIVMSLVSSTNLTLDNEMARRGYDVRIGFTRKQNMDEVLAVIDTVEGITDDPAPPELWYSRNATLLREGERLQDSAGLGAQLMGIPLGTVMIRPLIVEGRWLQPGDDLAIVISKKTADKNKIAVGDQVTLDLGDVGDATWEVVGAYRVVYGGGFEVELIYAPLDAVSEVVGAVDEGTQVVVAVTADTLDTTLTTADALKTAFADAGMDVDFYTTTVKLEERDYVNNQFNTVVFMLMGLAMLVASVGGLGLAGALGISVVERRRETGVLRAIGARGRTIQGLYIMEGLLQGVLSWLFALPLAFILAQPLARTLGRAMIDLDLDYAFNVPAVGIWLATVVVISVLASILPARSAIRISVRESLAYE